MDQVCCNEDIARLINCSNYFVITFFMTLAKLFEHKSVILFLLKFKTKTFSL